MQRKRSNQDNVSEPNDSDQPPFFPAGRPGDDVMRFTAEYWLSESIFDHFINRRWVDGRRAREMATCFISRNIDPVTKSYWDGEPLFYAAISNDPDGVRAAIAEGDDPNEKDRAEWAPLTAAVEAVALESVKALLQAGADPNAPNITGWRPLDQALHLERSDIAIALLEAGAKVEDGENTGMKAADILRSHWAPADVLAWLTEHGQTI